MERLKLNNGKEISLPTTQNKDGKTYFCSTHKEACSVSMTLTDIGNQCTVKFGNNGWMVVVKNKLQPLKLAEMAYVYAKMKWMKTFKAFDLEGNFVGNLIYCSMLQDTEENRQKLQRLADTNKTAKWQFQLRKPSNNSVVFETIL